MANSHAADRIWVGGHDRYKALSFANKASTSDSPLALGSAAPVDHVWEAGGSLSSPFLISVAFESSLNGTRSLCDTWAWPGVFLYPCLPSEHKAALAGAAEAALLSDSVGGEALTAAEPAFTFSRERDWGKVAFLFSVKGRGKKTKKQNGICQQRDGQMHASKPNESKMTNTVITT